MIYIYGDSHADRCFKGLMVHYYNLHVPSITMFRIGRDNTIINFNKEHMKKNDIIILSYGEVDCRCHIQKQINLGKDEDDVINELVYNYFRTIKNNTVDMNINIIIVGVIPPVRQYEFEEINGPIIHEFPFVGTDENRVRYTNKMNKLLEKMSIDNKYIYFNPYSYYTRPDGTLKFELSDKTCHLGNNTFFLNQFIDLLHTLPNIL